MLYTDGGLDLEEVNDFFVPTSLLLVAESSTTRALKYSSTRVLEYRMLYDVVYARFGSQ